MKRLAHAMRAYLAPTESFIYNQIASLERYEPVVVAHHLREDPKFPTDRVTTVRQLLTTQKSAVDALAYGLGRIVTPSGTTAIANFLRASKAQLIHYHYLTDARFLASVTRKSDLPTVVSGYGYDVSSFPRAFRGIGGIYLKPILKKTDLFLAMSEDMLNDMVRIGCPEDRTEIHYHGIDTARFAYPERKYEDVSPPIILCTGALLERKGQHHVLEALGLLSRKKRLEFRLIFVGDGNMRQRLEANVERYGFDDRVEFTGHIPHLSPRLVSLYHEAHIFVHPSVTVRNVKEGIPGTIVEAMAAGLPVVSTLHAGITSVINDSSGVLVPEGDIAALATALESLITSATLRGKLGRIAAHHALTHLDISDCTKRLEEIYDRLI